MQYLNKDVASPPFEKQGLRNRKTFFFVLAIAIIVYLALFLLISHNGYGGNFDSYRMLYTWQRMLADGVYESSRYSGNVPSEFVLGFFASLFGPTGADGVSFLSSVVSLALLFFLFTEICSDRTRVLLAVLTVACNPFWINATTTSMDYIHPIALCLAGIVLLEKRMATIAAILFAIASGARISYAPLGFGALVLYTFYNRREGGLAKCLEVVAVFAVVTALIYLPVFISSHLTLGFLGPARPTSQGVPGLLARWGYKSVYLYGLLGTLTIVYGVARSLQRAVPEGPAATNYARIFNRICIFIIVYHAALFFYIPARAEYLLPVLPAVAGLLLTSVNSNVFLVVLSVAQISYWFISIDVLKIDYEYNEPCGVGVLAVGAKIEPHLAPGILLPRLMQQTDEASCANFLLDKPANIHDRLPLPQRGG